LFVSKSVFRRKAIQINRYLREWNSVGFSSPSMIRNLEWILALEIEYDASTFDTDPFEPQPEGVCTIFPFRVENGTGRKLDWIAKNGGMALLNTHPDYMAFGSDEPALDEYAVDRYVEFLRYLENRYRNQYWQALPREVARVWRRSDLSLTK
jgi:hypothetical protein